MEPEKPLVSKVVQKLAMRPGLTNLKMNPNNGKSHELFQNPPRTYQRILQLLRGEVAAEVCASNDGCECCSKQASHVDHLKCAPIAELSANAPDPIESCPVVALTNNADLAVAILNSGVENNRDKYRKGNMGAASSSLTKRQKTEDMQDKNEKEKSLASYRSSLYRFAASIPQPQTGLKGSLKTGRKEPETFRYWRVMYAKPNTRKHKVWEDDGVLVLQGNSLILRGSDGTELARTSDMGPEERKRKLVEDAIFGFGAKEIQILEGISDKDFASGAYLE